MRKLYDRDHIWDLARELWKAMTGRWDFKDGGIRLDKEYLKLAEYVDENFVRKENISLCESCYCMTKTIAKKCGKCGERKVKKGGEK
jgi:hypothetical protein